MNASGGGEGRYMFADLAELDRVIAKWQTFHDGIREDRQEIFDAAQDLAPPAEDGPSRRQAKAARDFMLAAVDHNDAMRVCAESYLNRLTATRAQYAADDQGNVDRLRNVEPG